jgi:hypothetical protein
MYGTTSSMGRDQILMNKKINWVRLRCTMYVTANFDYQVDFGAQPDVLNVHETRTLLSQTDEKQVASILNKGLPTLALIFYPALQGDYEMRCEGSALPLTIRFA